MNKMTVIIGIKSDGTKEMISCGAYSKALIIEKKNNGKFKKIIVLRNIDESYNCKVVKPDGEGVADKGSAKPEGEGVADKGDAKQEDESVADKGDAKQEGESVADKGDAKQEDESVADKGDAKQEGESESEAKTTAEQKAVSGKNGKSK